MNQSTVQPIPAQTGQVTVMPSETSEVKPRDKYKLLLYKLGIVEVVLGAVACVLWLASILVAVTAPPYCHSWDGGQNCYGRYFPFTYASTGVWCAVFLFVSGGLGIRIRDNASVAMYNANMVMSIVSATMMGVLLCMSVIAAITRESSVYAAMIAPHVLLALTAVAGSVVSTVHSAYCCAGVCCRKKHSGAVVYSSQPQQYVQLPNGQLMLVQGQPTPPQNYPVMMMSVPTNLQPSQAPGTVTGMPVPMVPPSYSVTLPQGGDMPGRVIQSESANTPPMSQPSAATATKQQEAGGQPYASYADPPSYDRHSP